MHDHAVARRRVARDLKFRNALDFHLAEPATAVDAELGMVAVVRDIHPRIEHCLQERRAFGRVDHTAVYRYVDGLRSASQFFAPCREGPIPTTARPAVRAGHDPAGLSARLDR